MRLAEQLALHGFHPATPAYSLCQYQHSVLPREEGAMPLPGWTAEGLLPVGVHRSTLDDLYERFVLDAPSRERRELLFSAFRTYLTLLKDYIPAGRVWVDGGFCTTKIQPPHDVDVAILPSDLVALNSLDLQKQTDLYGLLTLQDVLVGHPTPRWLERVQPVGGALDAFLVMPGQEQIWHDTWSTLKRPDGTLSGPGMKGFAEVTW